MAKFTNRIVGHGEEPLDGFQLHPENWRTHPTRQERAVKDSMTDVGWVRDILINLRRSEAWPEDQRGVKTLVDGELRVNIARASGDETVPVSYVDLDPDEERFVLATLDPLGALANTDADQLMSLVADENANHGALKAALRGAGIDVREILPDIEQNATQAQDSPHAAPVVVDPGAHPDPLKTIREVARIEPKPAAQVSKPADRERYPLAIVLDRRYYEKWQAWKAQVDERSDTAALCAFLDNYLESEVE